jgi:hypothetical protein
MILEILLGLVVAGAASDTVPAPSAIPRERGSIVVVAVDGRAQRWTAEWTMEPSREQGRPAVRFTETGRGRYSPYTQPVRWSLEAVWSADGSFYPLRFDKTITDEKGHTATERKVFDPRKGTVQFERKREGKTLETRQFPAPPDTLSVEGIAGILRFLPFDHWQPFDVHLFTNEPQLYEVKIEMRGKERIKTPAGEFECYKIEFVPKLGVLNVVRPFLPKTYFWFSAAAPHFWVRYQGFENGRGTPEIVMELKSYEPGR